MKYLLPLFLLLGACAQVSKVSYTMGPFQCEADEVRPSWFSTITTATCWNQENRTLGLVSATGMPLAQVVVDAAQGAAIIGAGVAAGKAIDKVSRGVDLNVVLPH